MPRNSLYVSDGAMMVRTCSASSRKRRTGSTPYVAPAFGSVSIAGSGMMV